jgi:hypothetical protein
MRNGGLADSLELIHRQAKIQALVPADAVEGACGSLPMPFALCCAWLVTGSNSPASVPMCVLIAL